MIYLILMVIIGLFAINLVRPNGWYHKVDRRLARSSSRASALRILVSNVVALVFWFVVIAAACIAVTGGEPWISLLSALGQ